MSFWNPFDWFKLFLQWLVVGIALTFGHKIATEGWDRTMERLSPEGKARAKAFAEKAVEEGKEVLERFLAQQSLDKLAELNTDVGRKILSKEFKLGLGYIEERILFHVAKKASS